MKRLFSTRLMTAAGLMGCAIALPAAAQFPKPEDAIKYRKAAFTVMSPRHFGIVAGMANGKIPFDAKAAAGNAEIATMVSKLPYAGFVEGSDKGGDTKAEPKIWTEMDKFRAAGQARHGGGGPIRWRFGDEFASVKMCGCPSPWALPHHRGA